ncbi:MAG: hypothetical protein IAI49_12185, partial [Candidatus Eremiobacteraeota bacterium]|nr:hypothetical protein [Candidatus Eremiobacteraeota bacterium]
MRLRFGAHGSALARLRSLPKVDLLAYVKALGLLVRNPQICLGPLLAAVANVLLFSLVPADGGFIGYADTSIVSIVAFLIDAAGLALAIVAADGAWRYGRAPLATAFDDARRRAGDIFIAAIGFSFLVSVAGLVGGTFGGPGSIVLTVAAFVLCIYMLPAAAIGGIPGGASLQVSAERVRNSPIGAILIAVVFFAGTKI